MGVRMTRTKLCVRDVEAAERFYEAIGLKKIPGRKFITGTGGASGNVHQDQSWLSESGDESTTALLISRFIDYPDPPPTAYPGKAWLMFMCANVDETIESALGAGGSVVIPAADIPAFKVRAAVIADNEGHNIELVGPSSG